MLCLTTCGNRYYYSRGFYSEFNMAPTAIKEGEMTKEEEAKAAKVEKRKKAEASKKEDKDKEPSAKMAKKEEKPEPVSIYQTILAMERKESEVGLISTR